MTICKNSTYHPPAFTLPMPVKRMLRRKEVEHKTGLSRATIYRLMSINLFPKCSRIGLRAVAWDEQEVDAWLSERQGKRTSSA